MSAVVRQGSNGQQVGPATNEISQTLLDSMNVEQETLENVKKLNAVGGYKGLCKLVGVDPKIGLTHEQVVTLRAKFGENKFPESPLTPFYILLKEALSDHTLLLLLFSATISLVLGLTTGDEEHRSHGWIEGAAIYFAVALVSFISAGNDYSKQMQFAKLENSSAKDERCTVLRNGVKERINPIGIVIGDIIVMQAGDQVPADAIIVDENNEVKANEASLTGEPDDLKKSQTKDPFLLSSSLITHGEEVCAIAIGTGTHSQWGKIKANLVSESVNTPLQDKLEEMTELVGKIGMVAALLTFIALIIHAFTDEESKDDKQKQLAGCIHAFILGVTIVVVAIPEGLPLAVTISLAYSTSAMYKDQCFIRVLSACETMGNATNICSDKTGTLTENRMTVVEGWFGDHRISQDDFAKSKDIISQEAITYISEQACINRSAYLVYNDAAGKPLHQPAIIGNKTEGALIMTAISWGKDYDNMKKENFDEKRDKIYSFNSEKKRSTCIIHRKDGSVRLFCKGASEWIIKDCSQFTGKDGKPQPMTEEKRAELVRTIDGMADCALRTLCLAHKDYPDGKLPQGWEERPPDNFELQLDCIVGIIDPLRDDVKEAVKYAQKAGIMVRMVTGDNVATAKAIARQCGILTEGGTAIEGPIFRKMSPAQVDELLPTLQVMARSSPEDKFLLVTRLNGANLPKDVHEWEKKHADKIALGASWEKDRDLILPGYLEEWESTRPEGGQVVGVTGDGTNDAPALKAANVGLAMGITGTKVAQGAADIVILDDKFSSIVKAIMWGRSVYDNIRKFLQFQLTVNVVALTVVFIGAVTGAGEPLNAVQMLWVNLVMDTMGALALGTEAPDMTLLERRPYKRSALLISNPMKRFIIGQAIFQISMIFLLMFVPQIFNVETDHGIKPLMAGMHCMEYKMSDKSSNIYSPDGTAVPKQCSYFKEHCHGHFDSYCLKESFEYNGDSGYTFSDDWLVDCEPYCPIKDYTHGTVIFNSFIYGQLFNEFNARDLFDGKNPFKDLWGNFVFLYVIIITIGLQTFLVYVGGDFVKTSPISAENYLICIGFGSISLLFNLAFRYIPVVESEDTFFGNPGIMAKYEAKPQP